MVGVHNFDQSTSFLKGGLRDMPKGYPENYNAFDNLCLISSVIYCYTKIVHPEIHEKIKKLIYARSSRKHKNEAGRELEKWIQNLCSDCNLSQTGPHDMFDALKKISDHLNIQVSMKFNKNCAS
jgi:hypothetical protein